jgi:hypothetical protein
MGNGGVAPPFLNWALGGVKWSASRPCRVTPRKRAPCIHCTGDKVGPRSWSGRYREEKNLLPLPGIGPRFLGRPARSLIAISTEL